MQHLSRWFLVAAVASSSFLSTPAAAQPTAPDAPPNGVDSDVNIEVPVLILDLSAGEGATGDEEIDLANVVQSAAKGVTTVQEAPAIVTVLTRDDIVSRGFDNLEDAIDTVPGWMRASGIHDLFPFPQLRGQLQSIIYMHNGMSLFDPWGNTPQINRIMPVETIKRVELVTGPGGVLWGANSYLGIVNVITRDADDIDGVEVGVSGGDGAGDRRAFYGYVLAGIPELFHDDVSLVLHGSVESFKGPALEMPQMLLTMPLPQPNSPMIYGPLTESDQPRSTFFLVDGTLSVGELDIRFFYPFAEHNTALGFPGVVTDPTLAERDLTDENGDPLCPEVPLHLPDGTRNPEAYTLQDACIDRARIGGNDRKNFTDRYVVAEYEGRFADGKAGAAVKGYFARFSRSFERLNILAPSTLAEGGLSFSFESNTSYRFGGALDGDVELPSSVRLLYGAEAFREWVPDDVSTSRQGPGLQSNAVGPADLGRLPLPCPLRPDADMPGSVEFVPDCPLTFTFQIDRTVLGAYVNPQWKPTRRLVLDGGVRLQAGFGEADYEPQLIFSGAAVYQLWKNWHAKLNYAEGFRPPVFNNLASNGNSIQLDGDRDLEVETSQAIQGEVNARLFKGERRLREVNFRADYSYTRLENLIQLIGGRYQNTSDRGIHSVEFLGKIYLKGDHQFQLGYTWIRVDTEDFGRFRTTPEHWFNLGGVFTLIPGELQAATTFKVLGAFEDPNRMVEYRDVAYNDDGTIGPTVTVNVYEKVMDRIPPAAELQLALTYVGLEDFVIRAAAYNAFNTRHYNPDPFHSMDPRLEILPNPYPDFRAVLSASYQY